MQLFLYPQLGIVLSTKYLYVCGGRINLLNQINNCFFNNGIHCGLARIPFFYTLIMEEYKEVLHNLLSSEEINLGHVLSACVCIYYIVRHIFNDKEVDEIVPNPKY